MHSHYIQLSVAGNAFNATAAVHVSISVLDVTVDTLCDFTSKKIALNNQMPKTDWFRRRAEYINIFTHVCRIAS